MPVPSGGARPDLRPHRWCPVMWSRHVDHAAPPARPAPGTLHAVPCEVLNFASRAPRRSADQGEHRTNPSRPPSARAQPAPVGTAHPGPSRPTRARPGPRAPETHPLPTSPPPTPPTRKPVRPPPPSETPPPNPLTLGPPTPPPPPPRPSHPHPRGSCFRPGPALARPVVFCSTPRPHAPDLHIQAPPRGRHLQHPSPRGRTASHQFLSESLTRLEALRTLCQQALT